MTISNDSGAKDPERASLADPPAPLDVSVVVPVFNNAGTLSELCERLVSTLAGCAGAFEIVLVDDGSRDDSWRLMRALRASDPRIRALRLSRNFGQAAALCAGFEASNGEVVVTIDADLQNFPEDIPALMREIDKGHDLVSGYRVAREDPTLLRRLPSKIFNRLVQRITRVQLRDFGCGLNALSRRLAGEIARHGEMRRFLKPLAALLADSITELPVRHGASGDGASRYTFMSLLALNLDFLTSFSRRPFHLIGVGGVLLFALGFAGGITLLVALFGFGVSLGARVQSLLVLAMIFGLQLAVLGLLGEFIVRIFHAHGQPFYVIREQDD